ncbi:60S ribosomal protein L9 [Moesziomyces antarcticus T-34]|uniref:GPN-loop GTPase n=1 Tax=Pseudozyma antarctica (strain T-34) TaxID=1151754 RepID=M9MFR8_PSEA3|nr:60S ribosomal protein L9 [Moesziomyces antarcticus T-34]
MASSSTLKPPQSTTPAPQSAATHLELLPEIPRASSIIVIGMAGSGKSTFTASLHDHLHEKAQEQQDAMDQEPTASSSSARTTAPYMVNLDPAVGTLGYEPNVDIRDTVDYARVMEQYNLGPNGGILTALNLFTTKFDQVLGILEKRAKEVDHIVLDTPGQIEIFTWSASGSIVTDALASSMPTVVAYIIDTPRTTAPATFMSNMLYACSILYKTKLPFVLVFNKTDVQDHQFALEWMQDFEKFQEALAAGNATDPSATVTQHGLRAPARDTDTEGSQGYMNSLMNSMSLVLDEFYKNLRAVGVSSVTGEGMDDFLNAVHEARQEYLDDYRPQLERLAKERDAKRESSKKEQLARLMKDMKVGGKGAAKTAKSATRSTEDLSQPIDETYEGDGQIIEPDSDEEKPHYEYPGPDYDRGDGTVWPRPG